MIMALWWKVVGTVVSGIIKRGSDETMAPVGQAVQCWYGDF